MPRIRILIMESDLQLRQRVHDVLSVDNDITIVGEASGYAEMLARINQTAPDVLLLNITVGGCNSIGFIREIKANHPGLKIIAATMNDQCDYVVEIPPRGASSLFYETDSLASFLNVLKAMVLGPASPAAGDILLIEKVMKTRQKLSGVNRKLLTARETQVLLMLVDGETNQTIARTLSLKPSTVRTHRSSIMVKLGIPDQTDLLKYAAKNGVISLNA